MRYSLPPPLSFSPSPPSKGAAGDPGKVGDTGLRGRRGPIGLPGRPGADGFGVSAHMLPFTYVLKLLVSVDVTLHTYKVHDVVMACAGTEYVRTYVCM